MLFIIIYSGFSNTIGRVLCGFIADLSFISPLHKGNNKITELRTILQRESI